MVVTDALRMPTDETEARAVYARWDQLNGRYYVEADVRLSNSRLHRDVVFDGDTRVAVEVNGRPIYEQPMFIGQDVAAFLVTSDYSPGRQFKVATAEERAAFGGENQS